jgi:hypothetical protein
MRFSSISLRSGRTWWLLFVLLIAVPALALALLGLRVVQLERIEHAEQIRDQQAQLTHLADVAITTFLASVLGPTESAMATSTIQRRIAITMCRPSFPS